MNRVETLTRELNTLTRVQVNYTRFERRDISSLVQYSHD